jgi:hypothetical protein
LVTEHIRRPSRRNSPIKPDIAPIHQAKAVAFAIVSRRLDQELSPPPFATPDTREGWVKGTLHFILEVVVSSGQTGEEIRQVGRVLIPQISFDQIVNG